MFVTCIRIIPKSHVGYRKGGCITHVEYKVNRYDKKWDCAGKEENYWSVSIKIKPTVWGIYVKFELPYWKCSITGDKRKKMEKKTKVYFIDASQEGGWYEGMKRHLFNKRWGMLRSEIFDLLQDSMNECNYIVHKYVKRQNGKRIFVVHVFKEGKIIQKCTDCKKSVCWLNLSSVTPIEIVTSVPKEICGNNIYVWSTTWLVVRNLIG